MKIIKKTKLEQVINLHAGGRVKSTARSAEKKRKNKIKQGTSPDTGTSRIGVVLKVSSLVSLKKKVGLEAKVCETPTVNVSCLCCDIRLKLERPCYSLDLAKQKTSTV